MKVLCFEADRLHGYLNFNLNFQSDLEFLTGINGSGKTSALRSMMSLLSPSLLTLATTEYERISVTVLNEDAEIIITARRSDDEVMLNCSAATGNLAFPILRKNSFETENRFLSRQRDFLREYEVQSAHHPTLAAIYRLPTPMYLDLERRHEGSNSGRRGVAGVPLAGPSSNTLRISESLAERAFAQYSARRTERTNTLKQEIILAAFRPIEDINSFPGFLRMSEERTENLGRLERIKKVVSSSLSEIGVADSGITNIVLPFFSHAREVIDNVPDIRSFTTQPVNQDVMKKVQEWAAIQPQIRQIAQLVDLIDRYNAEVAEMFRPFGVYLESVNKFLGESGKMLEFDPEGQLLVDVRKGMRPRRINALSSGERQLVVILTHLAFNEQAKSANVLIIDEPELSLHLHWQEMFVDALLGASPGIQLILATHSPAIIGARVDKCIDVMEAQQSDSLFG